MSKKIILGLVGIFLFFGCNTVFANVIINEARLYPTEDRFIELYNQGNSVVDLTNWYIQRKTSSGNFTSLVSKNDFGNNTIGPGNYFLISRTSIKNSNLVLGDLTLTESNTIQIKDANGNVTDKIGWGNGCDGLCTQNPTDSQSVQRNQDSLLTVGTFTPGEQNYVFANNTVGTGSGSFGGSVIVSSTQNTETKTKTVEISKIKTEIIAKNIAFVRIPVEFSADTTGYSNEKIYSGKYFWNFGDGDSKETETKDTAKFSHTFFYEGEYVIGLQYYQNYYSEIPDAVDKMILKVVPTNVSISNVGDEKDFFVEISNYTDYDVDISKWILSNGVKSFTLPRNTILESKNKIILSPKITGFSVLDKSALKLLNSQWETVFDYASINKPIKVSAKNSTSVKIATADSSAVKSPLGDFAVSGDEQMPIDNLKTAALESNVSTGNNLVYEIGLFIFLGLSASGAYFVRSRKKVDTFGPIGNDFEIIDE